MPALLAATQRGKCKALRLTHPWSAVSNRRPPTACREPLFPARYRDEDLVAMLLGYKPLPWEANPNLLFQVIHSATACRLIRHLLR